MRQNPLPLVPAVTVVRRDDRGEQACTLHSGPSKGSNKLVLYKTRCNSGFMLCWQKIFMPIKFCHYIHTDFCGWSGNFC